MSKCMYLKQKVNRNLECKKDKNRIPFKDCKGCPYKDFESNNNQISKPLQANYKQPQTTTKLRNKSNKLARLEKNRFSIIYPDLTKCCNCGSKIGIQKNEVFEGSYRQVSIKLGMVCPFCWKCHNLFHNDIMFNLFYKVMFEKEYLKTHTKEEFIKTFGQDYIFKLEQKKRS